MLLITGLAASSWWTAGAYLKKDSRQRVADAWDAVRVCVLGEAVLQGVRPSERRRLITLAIAHTPEQDQWPNRCLPYARELDRSLEARSMKDELGQLPSAAALVASDAETLPDLDLLHSELELADLPLPQRNATVPPAPAPATPLLRRHSFSSIGKVVDLADIDVALDGSDGQVLRLLLPDRAPVVCQFGDGPRAERWKTVACRVVPMATDAGAHLRLARSEPGAADLIYVHDSSDRDGFYDSATGLRIWRPNYFDAQAVIRANGSTTILYADMRDDLSRERVELFRLLQLTPGKRPRSRRAKVRKDARVLLLPDLLMWWQPNEEASADELMFAPLTPKAKRPVGKATRLGDLPRESRRVADCASNDTTALLTVAGIRDRRYALTFIKAGQPLPPLDVGVIEGKLALSCHDGNAYLMRHQDRRIASWRCTQERCIQAMTNKLPMEAETLVATAPLSDKLALAWAAPGEPLRLRIAKPEVVHEADDTIIVDDEVHDGLEPTSMRMISADGLAMLLLQDEGRRVYALRLDRKEPLPVRIVR